MEQMFYLPSSLRNALLGYLSSKPYAEVAEGVQALQALQPVLPPVGTTEPETERTLALEK